MSKVLLFSSVFLIVSLYILNAGFVHGQDNNGTENIPPGENETISDIESLFYSSMQSQYQDGTYPWLRQAHAKQHGCVRGYLSPLPNLPYDLNQGVFANQTTYPIFIRFSNGLGHGFSTLGNNDGADAFPDTRGMAIKMFGVPGTKFIQADAETQDFLSTTSQQGFLPSGPYAEAFFTAIQKGTLATAAWAVEYPIEAGLLAQFGIDGAIGNLLNANWFTQAPSRMTYKAAKFRIVPGCDSDVSGTQLPGEDNENRPARQQSSKQVNPLDHDYLQTQLMSDLGQNGTWCFTMQAQLFEDDEDTPIEDATVVWNTDFTPIATITIPQQYVWSSGQDAFCRAMSFNPWNSIEEHRPLGCIQRIRHTIYTNGAAQRRGYLGQSTQEPTYADWQNYPNL